MVSGVVYPYLTVSLEHTRMSLFGVSTVKLQALMARHGYMGNEAMNTYHTQINGTRLNQFQEDFNMGVIPKYWSVTANIANVKSRERKMRQFYADHNQRVIDLVPEKDLLIWNVKDGWAPLCAFLGEPVPSGLMPHDNKGNTNWMDQYAWQSAFVKKLQLTAMRNLALLTVRTVLIFYGLLSAFRYSIN